MEYFGKILLTLITALTLVGCGEETPKTLVGQVKLGCKEMHLSETQCSCAISHLGMFTGEQQDLFYKLGLAEDATEAFNSMPNVDKGKLGKPSFEYGNVVAYACKIEGGASSIWALSSHDVRKIEGLIP